MALKDTGNITPQVHAAEHDAVTQAKKVKIVDAFGGAVTSMGNWSVMLDEASSTTTYVGYAQPGSDTSDAVWQIFKLLESGTVTSKQYADGSDSFTNVWDDRASLAYS